ncbi:BOS complex subunit NCLN [Cylas formicarius]|uniref:BOS complex subunit NCLN n=1 Tax=Cylas formicarius TaxID=197179 RepID=UPI002958B4BC|nr:BOS complex subunit NCLN [Cylas formicarius]
MLFQEVEELLKGYLPYYILIFLPIFIIISPASPVSATHEFPVHRMQHYDLHGVPYGSRAAAVNFEARAATTWTSSRHCVVAKLLDISVEMFRNIRSKAGALVLVLPQNITKLSQDEKQQLLHLEYKMLHEQETPIPVYFVPWNQKIEEVVDELASIDTSDTKKTAAEALITTVAANGYQVVITAGNSNPKSDVKIASFHGHLPGYRPEGKVPTIAIVTHYDSFGVAPDLSFGADSNSSGVIIMLELMRLFSALYADQKTRGKFNILFVLTGGGKINFQGTKKWLEDQLDSTEISVIQDTAYVLCLDTLATADTIYMHVSKPPKEGTPSSLFFKNLKSAAERGEEVSVEGVHKKINLADDILAWEHERFSIRRLPAFTLSSLKNHKDSWKSTILDTKEVLDMDQLVKNTKVIADAIGNYVYNFTEGSVFGGNFDVSKDFMEAWLEYLSSRPRSTQLLSSKSNALLTSLQQSFNAHLSDVKVTYSIPDKRDPDYQFYGSTQGVMNIYSVKPAIFDLVLSIVIALYLGLVYLAIENFPYFYIYVCGLAAKKKNKSN